MWLKVTMPTTSLSGKVSRKPLTAFSELLVFGINFMPGSEQKMILLVALGRSALIR